MTPPRVLVCGGRNYADRARAFATLDRFRDRFGIDYLIHGGATGADALAREWAIARGVEWVGFHADWLALGRAAGPLRNAQMLRDTQPHVVIAFPGGRGTADMIDKARRAGVRVYEIPARRS